MRSIAFVLSIACLLFGLKASSEYDYYVFATEWAGTVCRNTACSETKGIDPNFFNIHGLWPSQHSSTYEPSNCHGPSFSDSYLTNSTMAKLKRYWSGLFNPANDFHTHEWTKHGTCWNDDLETKINVIEDFFQHVMNVAQDYNAHSILTQAGIVPGSVYPLQKIQTALAKAYGSMDAFVIHCQAGQLNELQVCLDKNYKPMSCPKTTKLALKLSGPPCGSIVGYPAIHPSLLV